jgi:hypothetical protein
MDRVRNDYSAKTAGPAVLFPWYSHTLLLAVIELTLYEVSYLPDGETVAFKIHGQLPSAVDDDSVEGVGEQTFVTPEVHAEKACHLLYLRL